MIAVTSLSELHLLGFADRKALRTELAKLDRVAKGRIGIGKTAPSRQIGSELIAFFDGTLAASETPLAYHGSEFTKMVWDELRKIPVSETLSYSQIAEAIGRPTAVRAVAPANGVNQIALVIP